MTPLADRTAGIRRQRCRGGAAVRARNRLLRREPAGRFTAEWVTSVFRCVEAAPLDELDKVVEELKRKEKVDGRKKRE
jgi:hypothetical protein